MKARWGKGRDSLFFGSSIESRLTRCCSFLRLFLPLPAIHVLPFDDSVQGISGNLFETYLKPYFQVRPRNDRTTQNATIGLCGRLLPTGARGVHSVCSYRSRIRMRAACHSLALTLALVCFALFASPFVPP